MVDLTFTRGYRFTTSQHLSSTSKSHVVRRKGVGWWMPHGIWISFSAANKRWRTCGGIHGFIWDLYGIYVDLCGNYMGFMWELCGFTMIYMDLYGFIWIYMGIIWKLHGFTMIYMDFYGINEIYLRDFVGCYGIFWDCHGDLWEFS